MSSPIEPYTPSSTTMNTPVGSTYLSHSTSLERTFHTTNQPTSMAQASDFGGACLKLEEIANLADKIHNQYGNGEVSFARSLLLPGEIEKLCKAMGKVGVEEFRGLDVAAERKGVVSAKWLTAVRSLTFLTYPIKSLPSDHPKRSKMMKERMIRVLGEWEKETEKVRVAVEACIGEELEVGGKKIGKGSHLVTQISRLVDEWKGDI